MATLSDIETEVLLEIGEDTSDPAVFSGTDELRSGLADAIDELCMYGEFFMEKLQLRLLANTAFYSVALQNHWPLWIKKARLVEQNRDLECETLNGMEKYGSTWLLGRGSPYVYVPLGPGAVIVWPCYASNGGIVELDVVCAPKAYGADDLYLSLSQKFELALIAYGRYVLLLKSGDFQAAMLAFNDYLSYGGLTQTFGEHQHAASVKEAEDVSK